MSWLQRVIGDAKRLGLWTLPMFVAVGLLGAVLAGSLAAVYYSQKVRNLESETAAARRDLTEAAERVNRVADEAVKAIESEVAEFREEITVTSPIDDPATAGIASVNLTVSEPLTPSPGPGASPAPREQVQRHGSAVAVIAGSDATFFATSFAVVQDPDNPAQGVAQVDLVFDGRRFVADVHSWAPARDLALLRVPGQVAPVVDWRPPDAAISSGSRAFVAGLTPTGTFTQLSANIGSANREAIILDTGIPDVLRGAAILDAEGRIVGLASAAYRPYGSVATTAPAMPVRLLCLELINCN